MKPTRTTSWFTRFSKRTARHTGHSVAFSLAVGIILAWAVSGPLFDFSETWQMVINTVTSIVTFLMVFLIQSTQNRDSEAIQVKLDELICATRGAHHELLDLEELDETELDRIRAEYRRRAERARDGQRPDAHEERRPAFRRAR
jgi:low affinity Fe/Cu permease